MLRKWGTLVLLLLITPMLALAQNTGKIAGTILDAETGEALPGASVALVGTQLGTISDVDGAYFIIGVPVGAYNVQASFVGYQTQTRQGVEVSSGYTSELNFTLSPGLELDEIVVEYERPLIQKDAVGVPKIVSGEAIVNLPVRGAANVASIQAGVVSQEGSGTLNVRGGRGSEVSYYIDGVKVIGSNAVPQSAVQEQEMIIGNISARYGDAMSGIISITTKSGSQKFFGSFEGVTSEALDAFGYNLASGAIGGPIAGDKVGFFLAGEYTNQGDSSPNAIGQLRIDDALLNNLRAAPTVMTGVGEAGDRVYIEIPATLGTTRGADGSFSPVTLPVDDNGVVVVNNNQITASDGTVISVPAGAAPETISFDLLEAAAVLEADDFEIKSKKRSRGFSRYSLDGNMTFNLLESVRLRLGGRYINSTNDTIGANDVVFAPEAYTTQDRGDAQFYATWTHYLSNSTFYQLQFDYSDRTGESYDNRFPTLSDAIFQGDIDRPEYATLLGYKNLSFVTETRTDAEGHEFTVQVPTYRNKYADGVFPTSETITRLVTPPGGLNQGFSQFHNQQIRFNATATTQIGLHQVEFGAEFEQRTNRFFSVSTRSLARYYADGNPELLETGATGFQSYEDLTWKELEGRTNNYGYTFNGVDESDDENLTGYVTDCADNPAKAADGSCYSVAPHKPIYYGGYIQDKIEFRDIVLNLGLRVDVFDNNTRTLFDPYARLAIERAGDLGLTNNIVGEDYAVYFNGDDLAGFRDLDGNFYNPDGQQVQAGTILLTGAKPRSKTNLVTEEVYVDYEPEVTLMPRIGVSFPVTDQALFFARYGVVAQRPSSNAFSSLEVLSSPTGTINNNALQPEKIVEYELGFRQRVGARAAMTISGFFRQIKNLIQLSPRRQSSPSAFTTYDNFDFGTVKGVEFDFDLRRTNNVALNANYTVSFAQGTGSSSGTTSTIVWIDETPPNFISPLDFDQRHRLNVSIDYRLGQGEGPTVFGAKALQNFGVNILATAGSGFPYTATFEPFNQADSKAPLPSGGINENRTPWTSRIDIRVDRRFPLGGANLSAFVWVQNLLDADNVFSVWSASGLPDDDGFLATSGGRQFLAGQASAAETLYRHRNRGLGRYGIPRMTRIGVRLDF